MELSEIFDRLKNKTLEVGFRFHADSFQCTESSFGEVTFEWRTSNTDYKIAMKTDLHIPQIKKGNYSDYEWIYEGRSGTLDYTETKRDDVTGKKVSRSFKVKFKSVFEYQSDHNLHVVQFIRVPEESETTKGWVFESYNEGMMYLTGEGFTKDKNKAIEMFREAADQGHAGAKKRLEELGNPAPSSDNGDTYDGDVVNGFANGKGKKTWANGDTYEGDWVNGNTHGKGKMTYANGNVYEGDWIEGFPNGKGKMTWANGNVYEGDWVNGEDTGKGKMTYANGNVYEGDWIKGFPNCKGTMTLKDGNVYEGDYIYFKEKNISLPQGNGKITYANGKIEEGRFENGNFIG